MPNVKIKGIESDYVPDLSMATDKLKDAVEKMIRLHEQEIRYNSNPVTSINDLKNIFASHMLAQEEFLAALLRLEEDFLKQERIYDIWVKELKRYYKNDKGMRQWAEESGAHLKAMAKSLMAVSKALKQEGKKEMKG